MDFVIVWEDCVAGVTGCWDIYMCVCVYVRGRTRIVAV